MAKDNIKKPDLSLFVEQRLKVGDIYINYAEAGKGKPIIMVHGWTNNWIGLVPLGKELINDHRVILIDLPGYGKSDRLEKYSLEIEANYIEKFATALKLKRYILVGHSMGSMVVAKFYQLFPNKPEKIVLIGAVFKKNNKEGRLKITHKIYSLAKEHGLLRSLLNKIINRDSYAYLAARLVNMYKFDKRIIDLYGMIKEKNVCKKVYVEIGEELMREETKIEEMINDKIPVLFIFGKYDKITNLKQAKGCLEGKGDFRFEEIDESGHIVTVEKPKEVADTIRDFILEK